MKTFAIKLIVAVSAFAILTACGKDEKKPAPAQEPVVEAPQPEPVIAEPEPEIEPIPEPAPVPEAKPEPAKPAPKAKAEAKPEPAKPEPVAAPEPPPPPAPKAEEPKPQAAEKPKNPFLGKWVSRDGKDHRCILDFKDGGVLVVEQYQTYGDGLVTCTGKGTYSYSDSKLAFSFKLANSDKSSSEKCGTDSRDGNQSYKMGADKFDLTGNESDGKALLRSWFNGKGKISNTDYYKSFVKIK
ncbi:MAG: hypothetical protein FWC26_07670 [Fibromonadales bacterium]|nr:hypothetical protein [Fibromonadales bacterium]